MAARPTGRVATTVRVQRAVPANAIVASFSYTYKPGKQEEADALLDKMREYYKSKGELGKVLLQYSFTHSEAKRGYTATEVYASAAAFNTHIENTMAYPEIDKLMSLTDMINEESSTFYATASEFEKAPQIKEFYQDFKFVEGAPDLKQWITRPPTYGWTAPAAPAPADGEVLGDAAAKGNEERAKNPVTGAVARGGAGGSAAAPIILTIENRWNQGKTLGEVTTMLRQMSATCMAIDGVYAFQYSVDEDKKANSLTEVYRDAAAIGAMTAATTALQSALFSVITTTRVICSGPRAQVDAVRETLASFGAEFFYTDAVSPAFHGFGLGPDDLQSALQYYDHGQGELSREQFRAILCDPISGTAFSNAEADAAVARFYGSSPDARIACDALARDIAAKKPDR